MQGSNKKNTGAPLSNSFPNALHSSSQVPPSFPSFSSLAEKLQEAAKALLMNHFDDSKELDGFSILRTPERWHLLRRKGTKILQLSLHSTGCG